MQSRWVVLGRGELGVCDVTRVGKERMKLAKQKKRKQRRRQGCDSEMQICFWVCRIGVGWKRIEEMRSKVLATNSLLSSFFAVPPFGFNLGHLSGEGRIPTLMCKFRLLSASVVLCRLYKSCLLLAC